ncbi:MAG: hypothetical protein FWC36_03840 [Spirochaetes bacterium]|nr:hypothetical protein [Spirochaetota bacterium]
MNTLLPLELAFVPFIYSISRNHHLGISINSKMGWQLLHHNNIDKTDHRFIGSIGAQLFLKFNQPGRTYFYRYLSLFADYNIYGEFRAGIGVGISLQTALSGLLALLLSLAME